MRTVTLLLLAVFVVSCSSSGSTEQTEVEKQEARAELREKENEARLLRENPKAISFFEVARTTEITLNLQNYFELKRNSVFYVKSHSFDVYKRNQKYFLELQSGDRLLRIQCNQAEANSIVKQAAKRFQTIMAFFRVRSFDKAELHLEPSVDGYSTTEDEGDSTASVNVDTLDNLAIVNADLISVNKL